MMRPKNSWKRASVVLILFLNAGLYAQHGTQAVEHKKFSTAEYIERYKDIAIREMERSGIPASITLAQGIHESGNGNSRLAREANNHFGIKCHEWKGQGFYQWDDDPTESCFRVYSNADSSYIDHTDFLMTRKRYAFMFEYERTDYVKWAHGLKTAGYATDPTYPQKLITTIEKHKLYQYDIALSPMPLAKTDLNEPKPSTQADVFVIPDHMHRKLRKKVKSPLFAEYKKGLFRQNGLTYATAKAGETALEFATRFDIPYRKFLVFNDLVDGDRLIDNQFCYIQPKKSKYKGTEVYHQVKDNESMYEISQYYGLKLHDLLERNLLTEGQEPRNGEMVLLNEKAFKAPLLRDSEIKNDVVKTEPKKEADPIVPVTETKTEKTLPAEKKPLLAESPTYPEEVYNSVKEINTAADPNESYVVPEFPTDFVYEPIKLEEERKAVLPKTEPVKTEPKISEKTATETKSDKAAAKTEKFIVHTVAPKETLFSIGKKYGISWEQIKTYNNLASNVLSEKQMIRIPR